MNSLFDILLSPPLPSSWQHYLLFAGFTAHMLFVLFTIGTAIIGVTLLLRSALRNDGAGSTYGRSILHTFMAHKSLAVVLGVSALLLMQIGYTVPFFTAVSLLAPYWLLIIVLLIAAFLLIDYVGQTGGIAGRRHVAASIAGLTLLLAVPGIFVAVLATAENSGAWLNIIRHGYKIGNPLAAHWLLRYLHILAAGVVFAAAFHYIVAAANNTPRKHTLLQWLVGGLLAQFVIGAMLYTSLPMQPAFIANVCILAGIAAAVVLLWLAYSRRRLAWWPTTALMLAVLLPMLLARQVFQDTGLLSLEKEINANATAYRQQTVIPNRAEALGQYQQDMDYAYDNGQTIFERSCAFCHGSTGEGNGVEAKNLTVPPEVIAAVHSTRPYLFQILSKGVPGSGMPYFSLYTPNRLNALIDYLNERYHVLTPPDTVPVTITAVARQQAEGVFASTCATCHGNDGRGTAAARQYQPPVPDFTVYNLAPQRAMDVITNGYPGTVMAAYGQLPADVRWGLAAKVQSFFIATTK